MNRSAKIAISAVAALVVITACLCLAGIVTGGALVALRLTSAQPSVPAIVTVAPEIVPSPTGTSPSERTPQPTPTWIIRAQNTQEELAAEMTLKTLEESEVPVSDLNDLAVRLKGMEKVPTALPAPGRLLQVGDGQQFWINNADTNQTSQVSAILRYITPHLYFWVEDGVSYNAADLKELADTFENKIYPTDREFFGSEWTPGVDNDPHLYILYAGGLGRNLAGYFSSVDEYNPQVHEYSNAHEMFMLNADNVDLGEKFTYGVLAHEFQHMIHWYRDRNEESWMNEGFSELAAFLNGYTIGGFDYAFIQNPDVQLNDWPNDPDATGPHYGAGFLFLDYFLDRFGEKATQNLVADPENGLVSVDDVLRQIGAQDPQTHTTISADDLFADWTVANYLQDPGVGDGRYSYSNYPNAPRAQSSDEVFTCPLRQQNGEVHQYAAQYIEIDCKGQYTLHFQGDTQVGVLPEGAHSGQYFFWSNKGDESDMTLTHAFDFTNVSGPLTFSYWIWYDVEKDYDYVYLEASTDGVHWQILKTPSSTDRNPSGNSYGWGYNGTTPNWIKETVDLSQFDGQKVQLRFEYVTDAAVNGEGFLLDDVSIPQIGYNSDFESDDGGWQGAGFVRIRNVLPQTYRLMLILEGTTTRVQPVALNPDQTADVTLNLSAGVDRAVLVVSGTTRFTRQEAHFHFSIDK